MARIAATTYPEPRTEGHDDLTERCAPVLAKYLEPGASVLDVGCGQGPAMHWFRAHGFEPTGCGINDEDLEVCRLQSLNVVRADMNDLPFADGAFDCVWARHVVEHSIAPLWTLTEFARVLKPRGILYVEVPMPDTSCRHESNQNHYSVLGHQMWLNLLWKAGFKTMESQAIKLVTGAGPDEYTNYIAEKL